MRRRTATIWSILRAPGAATCLQARRAAVLAALLMAASIAEGNATTTVAAARGNRSQQQVYQLAGPQLASTKAG